MGSSIVATRFYRTVYRENSAVFNTGVFQNPIFLQMPTEEPHFFRSQTVTVESGAFNTQPMEYSSFDPYFNAKIISEALFSIEHFDTPANFRSRHFSKRRNFS